MKLSFSRFVLFVFVAIAPFSVYALDITGYARGALGGNGQSGGLACFKLAGAMTKYRMGNECEFYGEVLFEQGLNKLENDSEIKAHVMVSAYQPMTERKILDASANHLSFVQAYMSWDKVPVLAGGSLWAGRRYYKREGVHITDFFYWNPSGLGAGFEDMNVGDLKLSYAWFIEDNENQLHKATRHDLQLRGIPTNANGQLELGLSLTPQSKYTSTGSDGWALTVQHKQSKIFGDGTNSFAIQYGLGPATGLGSLTSIDNNHEAERFRLIDGLYVQVTPKLGGMFTGVYQKDSSNAGNQAWVSLGGRVSYGMAEHLKMQVEIGQDWVMPSSAATRSLSKITIAPTWALTTNFWSRPELRLFYTYACWNDAASQAALGSKDAGELALAPTNLFGGDKEGSVIGVQVETWW